MNPISNLGRPPTHVAPGSRPHILKEAEAQTSENQKAVDIPKNPLDTASYNGYYVNHKILRTPSRLSPPATCLSRPPASPPCIRYLSRQL
jgi:hypothetical protein